MGQLGRLRCLRQKCDLAEKTNPSSLVFKGEPCQTASLQALAICSEFQGVDVERDADDASQRHDGQRSETQKSARKGVSQRIESEANRKATVATAASRVEADSYKCRQGL